MVDNVSKSICPPPPLFFFALPVQLLVYGAGQVIPSSLSVLQQDLKYSLAVGLSSNVQYGRVILAMDKKFCTDGAGNMFLRTANSTFKVHFGENNAL